MIITNNHRYLYSFIFLFLLHFAELASVQSLVKKTGTVDIVTEDQLLQYFDKDARVVIMTYMHHCPFCNMIKPEFEKLAKKYGHKNMTFAQANGPLLNLHKHVERETEKKLSIPGYPNFIFIKHGKIKKSIGGIGR